MKNKLHVSDIEWYSGKQKDVLERPGLRQDEALFTVKSITPYS